MGQYMNAILAATEWGSVMTSVLYYATIVLSSAGVLFALVYLIMNVIGKSDDLDARNVTMLRISRVSMILSLVFALVGCLLGDASAIDKAIYKADTLYSIIAISWLGVIAACGITLLCSIVFKSSYDDEVSDPIKKLFVIALWGAIIALVLAWLFS